METDADHQFCCNGCRTAYTIIHSCGLSRYYDLATTDPASKPTAACTSDRQYQEFDDPKFHAMYVRDAGPGVRSTDFYAQGIHCAACVWLIEKLPLVLPGVLESRVDFARSIVSVRWASSRVSLSSIGRFIDSLGYSLYPLRGTRIAEIRAREDRQQLIRIGVAGAIAGNVMLLAFALYAGAFSGIEAGFANLFRAVSAVLGLLSLAWPGAVFFKGAIGALRTRSLHMDVPIALGLGVGGIAGLVNTVRATGDVYFDTLSTLVFLLLVGRWIQSRQQRRAGDAVEMLYSLTPSTARLVEGDLVREIPIDALHPGDVVEVPAGATVPVDGEIVRGTTHLDQSLLTGEPMPIEVGPGAKVSAGAASLTAPIRIRVEAAGEQTRVGRLMQLVEEAAKRRPPIVRLADRVAARFVGVVIVLAALTAVTWLFIDPSRSISTSTALLIVTCPCALGLATPLAIVAAIGRAARRSILIKGGDALESLSARHATIVLDKTGTITEGRMRVASWVGSDDLKPLVGAVESRCAHPIAAAFARAFAAGTSGIDVSLTQTVGGGIEAVADNHHITIGSPAFVEHRTGTFPRWISEEIARVTSVPATPVVIACDGVPAAVAAVADSIRPDADSCIAAIRRRGWSVRILSGDHPEVVRAVGRKIGIPAAECFGAATPEQKLAMIEGLAGKGTVIMVGDGVNDTGALSAATVGVAVHAGADLAMNIADVYIGRPGLDPLRELLTGARRTRAVIMRNLGASLAYNVFCAALAMTGVIQPLGAAILMPISSLTVVLVSYRSKTFAGDE